MMRLSSARVEIKIRNPNSLGKSPDIRGRYAEGGCTPTAFADVAFMIPAMLPRLWSFALRLSGDPHDAEDLVQQACVRALERAHQLRPDTVPLSWMFSIIHSGWLNELRSRKVRGRSRVDWDGVEIDTIPDTAIRTPEDSALYAQVVSAIAQLPEPQRAVMLLVAIEGLSYVEAAQTLDVPLGTIMSRLSRARRVVGALFGGNEGKN
jgi:RNA polymerase sigma-70 factor (ECF subfamily)